MTTLLDRFIQLIHLSKPTQEDADQFFSLFAYPPNDEVILKSFISIQHMIQDTLSQLDNITFSPEFGFEGFTLSDIGTYLLDTSSFSLSLKRKAGQSILYGVDHAQLRRELFNRLPHPLRLAIGEQKLNASHLFPHLYSFSEWPQAQLVDIEDIGMGHSVYLLTLSYKSQQKKLVIKEKKQDSQVFFCDLLKQLGWQSFRSWYVAERFGQWEISDYLGSENLNDTLLSTAYDGTYDDQLAQHAALGDLLGRGDRHFENYLIYDGNLVPLDISFLFWPDNDYWTQHYIAGGVYEYSLLQSVYQEPSLLKQKKEAFWNTYSDTLLFLKTKQDEIQSLLHKFYLKSHSDAYWKYITDRFHYLTQNLSDHKALYDQALETLFYRLPYKKRLAHLFQEKPEHFITHDVLKMYYFANRNRSACFLHGESWNLDQLFQAIDQIEET